MGQRARLAPQRRRPVPGPGARRSTARCGAGASPSTSCVPTPISPATGWSSCRRCTWSPTRPPRARSSTSRRAARRWSPTSAASSTRTTTSGSAATRGRSGSCSASGSRSSSRSGRRAGRLDDGSTADVWTERLHLDGAEVIASYVDGPLPGVPAVTRNRFGAGAAWYVGTRLDEAAIASLVDRLIADSGIEPPVAAVPGLEVVTRADDASTFVFLLNHTTADHDVDLEGRRADHRRDRRRVAAGPRRRRPRRSPHHHQEGHRGTPAEPGAVRGCVLPRVPAL